MLPECTRLIIGSRSEEFGDFSFILLGFLVSVPGCTYTMNTHIHKYSFILADTAIYLYNLYFRKFKSHLTFLILLKYLAYRVISIWCEVSQKFSKFYPKPITQFDKKPHKPFELRFILPCAFQKKIMI